MLKQDNNVVMSLFGGKPVKRPLLVTFRIDERVWEAFGEYAENKNTDRSKLINKYIKKCLELEKD
jgi:hypothetical protein